MKFWPLPVSCAKTRWMSCGPKLVRVGGSTSGPPDSIQVRWSSYGYQPPTTFQLRSITPMRGRGSAIFCCVGRKLVETKRECDDKAGRELKVLPGKLGPLTAFHSKGGKCALDQRTQGRALDPATDQQVIRGGNRVYACFRRCTSLLHRARAAHRLRNDRLKGRERIPTRWLSSSAKRARCSSARLRTVTSWVAPTSASGVPSARQLACPRICTQRSSAQNARWPHALRIHRQDLSVRAGQVHRRSDPPNTGTKHQEIGRCLHREIAEIAEIAIRAEAFVR